MKYLGQSKFMLVVSAALLPLFISGCIKRTDEADNSSGPTLVKKRVPTAAEILGSMKSAGVPMKAVQDFTEETDPNHLLGRPDQYTSKAEFKDPRYPHADTISVEVFSNPEDAKVRHDYIATVTKGVAFLVQYQYLDGPALLRAPHAILPKDAKKYEVAFHAAMGG